jgi:hypothetical protein
MLGFWFGFLCVLVVFVFFSYFLGFHARSLSERPPDVRCALEEGQSHDRALLLCAVVELLLKPQPKEQSPESQRDDGPIEPIADGQQHRGEGPFDELSEGRDDVLGVHVVRSCETKIRKAF